MKRIGITGQNGFIGNRLLNRISLLSGEYSLVNFEKSFFSNKKKLQDFIKQCDIVVHLSGVNRSKNSDDLYNGNMVLTDTLIDAVDVMEDAITDANGVISEELGINFLSNITGW